MDKKNEEEILYQGNAIPKILRWVYLAFGVWATAYLVKNLVPDLLVWVQKTHV